MKKKKAKLYEKPQVVYDDETLDVLSPKFDPLKALNLPLNKRLALPFPRISPFKNTEIPSLEKLIAPDIEKVRARGHGTSGGSSRKNEPSKFNMGEAISKRRILQHQGKSINYQFYTHFLYRNEITTRFFGAFHKSRVVGKLQTLTMENV